MRDDADQRSTPDGAHSAVPLSRRRFLHLAAGAVAITSGAHLAGAQIDDVAQRRSDNSKGGGSVTDLTQEELDNARFRTEIPIAELTKYGERDSACRFVVVNDVHVTATDTGRIDRVVSRLAQLKPDFIAFVGDTCYGQGGTADEKQDIFRAARAASAKAGVPCHFGMGNTDMCPGDDPTLAFRAAFETEAQYSFDAGGIHFVMLYTEQEKPAHWGTIGKKELAWIKRDLDAVEPGAPIVLFGHHPLYVESKWEGNEWGIDNTKELFAALAPYHVVASFSGHRHLNRMALDRRGALHVTNAPMIGDHSDNVGPKNDGIGYRWVRIDRKRLITTWIQIGLGDLPAEF